MEALGHGSIAAGRALRRKTKCGLSASRKRLCNRNTGLVLPRRGLDSTPHLMETEGSVARRNSFQGKLATIVRANTDSSTLCTDYRQPISVPRVVKTNNRRSITNNTIRKFTRTCLKRKRTREVMGRRGEQQFRLSPSSGECCCSFRLKKPKLKAIFPRPF